MTGVSEIAYFQSLLPAMFYLIAFNSGYVLSGNAFRYIRLMLFGVPFNSGIGFRCFGTFQKFSCAHSG